MAVNDIDLCHMPQKSSTIILNKHIFDNIDDAKTALINRQLKPGEIAAVRYGTYTGFEGKYDNIHMILGVGGFVKGSGDDTYFFYDIMDPANYYTKDEIDNNIGLIIDNIIEEKLKELQNQIVTINGLSTALENNKYFNEKVIVPIDELNAIIKQIVTIDENNIAHIDGGYEESNWE